MPKVKDKTMRLKYCFIVLLVGLLWSSMAGAEKVAVFPVEDLSQGPNGVNFALTEYLEKNFEKQGLELVSQKAVVSFMARNRIRWLGFLNTYYILQARKELGADLILLGTVTQRIEKPPAAFGMVLYLIRTDDARTIWSYTGALSCNDVRNLFAVSEPESTEDLMPVVVKNMMANWPENIGLNRDQNAVFEIADVDLGRQHVSPGEKITCRVGLRQIMDEHSPEVSLKIQSKGFVSMKRKGGNFYEASWPAPAKEGLYPVSIILKWPSGKERIAFLGTYHVDSRPPVLTLGIRGVRLQGAVAFRDRIFIVPRLLERELISRWDFSIEDEEGRVILHQGKQDKLPTRFIWKGQCGDGSAVADGRYQIILKVWDYAQNIATVSEKVVVVRNPPDMILEARKHEQELVLDIWNKGEIPIAFWHLEMLTDDGDLIKTVEGEALTAKVDVTVPETAVECIVTARDILGNQMHKEIKDINSLIRQVEGEDKPQDTWTAEF